MLYYSNEQLATIIGVPIVTILLIWTVAIFHINRKKWNSYDIAVVAILIQSILRNIAILGYTTLLIAKQNSLTSEYCRVVVWIFNSVHTFQASSLTTLAVIALFTVKLYRKQQNLQQYLTPTHVIYHLFCLTTLCACVGVAAILAQEENTEQKNSFNFNNFNNHGYEGNKTYCKFMPFDLDIKFNIFIIVLHIFLAMVSLTSFIFICLNHIKIRRQGFDYLKKSTSDLSELSLSLTASVVNQNENVNSKNYYDTYTIQRVSHLEGNYDNNYEAQVQNSGQNHGYQNGFCNNNREPVWNSDLSNISMTVSSTNSKRPCLNKPLQEEEEPVNGLHTMYPILAVCYLFNHLPLIVLCIFPRLVAPWPVSGVALWMGQIQDVLIPIGLGLVDSRFCKWVSKVYKCSERRRVADKIPPGVGLDGKFRHFGSQPQSLEITQAPPERVRGYSPSEPKFPITNGSLYTSIDGRLPIIHNYRRHKDQRGCLKPFAPHSLNVNLHSSHLKKHDYVRPRQELHFSSQATNLEVAMQHQKHQCAKCENPHFPSQLNLLYGRNYPHINPNFAMQQHIRRDPSFNSSSFDQLRHQDIRNRRPLQKRISLSQDSLCRLPVLENMPPIMSKPEIKRPRLLRNKAKKLSLSNRISKSEDSLNDLQKDLQKFKQNPEVFQKNDHGGKSSKSGSSRQDLSCISSDDEYFTDSVNLNDTGPDYDATSQSSYSITTEANCDFEFFQSKDIEDTGTVRERENITESEDFATATDTSTYGGSEGRKAEFAPFKPISQNHHKLTGNITNFTDEILARSNSRNSKCSTSELNHLGRNFRITRSNSKRSLENFHAYVDEEVESFGGYKMQRSNSFMTIDDRKKVHHFNKVGKSSSQILDNTNNKLIYYQQNGKSLLQNLNNNIAYLEDIYNHNIHLQENYKNKHKTKMPHHGGSVPDFKKIFISEYI